MYDSAACPICTSRATDFAHKVDRLLLICEWCRHVFWQRMPTDSELDAYYQCAYTEQHDQLRIQESNRAYYRSHIADIARMLFKRRFAMLDVGSSYPTLVQEAIAAGVAGYAVDPSLDVLKWASERAVPTVHPDDIAQIPSVDIIRFSHTLEHCSNPAQLLSRCLTKLKAGGLVYVTQPNFPILKLGYKEIELKDCVWPSHLHFFNPLSLVTLLINAGLHVISFGTHPPYEGDEMTQLQAAADQCHMPNAIRRFGSPKDFFGMNSVCWASKTKWAVRPILAKMAGSLRRYMCS